MVEASESQRPGRVRPLQHPGCGEDRRGGQCFHPGDYSHLTQCISKAAHAMSYKTVQVVL